MKSSNLSVALLACDQNQSVLRRQSRASIFKQYYTIYGRCSPYGGALNSLGFNGEYAEDGSGHFLLGNGYRAFNPVLRRFNSPDSKSPFGVGGINAYAYCAGDPVNHRDPTGHVKTPIRTPSNASTASTVSSVWSSSASGSRSSRSGTSSASSSLSGSESDNGPWRLNKKDARFKILPGSTDPIEQNAQKTFDAFQNAIYRGESPFEIETDRLKILDKKERLYQIRLGKKHRATFTVSDHTVNIRDVGGHTHTPK
ncbi:RHS repeat-associated core domain-containing protein [Pseudomonas sp. R5(2019)]|uniref:RHS repeat-associated core domain-containing protein n=1 Tax=Pseudomonas sp. R5(2019) TaxID=2697566 RepID=UPI003531C9EA